MSSVSATATLLYRRIWIIGKCMPRHRAAEFRRLLDAVESKVPADLDSHVIMDNASSHKTKLIRDWFAKRPRWHAHFTPTFSSWISLVLWLDALSMMTWMSGSPGTLLSTASKKRRNSAAQWRPVGDSNPCYRRERAVSSVPIRSRADI